MLFYISKTVGGFMAGPVNGPINMTKATFTFKNLLGFSKMVAK
jgi:hypothetical protein